MQYMDVLTRSVGNSVGATKTEAKTQALSWLASQLRWEQTLENLRDDEHEDQATPKAA
ncbi:MAG TPA: hypothetical protein VNC41_07255 [Acidimicrobiia bacterium]|nr:hypothetical protein [Acidimicrobiia bacterium]